MPSQESTSTIHGITTVLWIGLLLATGCTTERNSAKLEMEKLQGTWHLVYQQLNGTKLPDEKAAEMFHGKVIFLADKIHYSVELPGFDFQFAYVLHPDQRPKGIDLSLTDTPDKQGIGKKIFGIYLLVDGTLKICHNTTNRPTEFSAGEGSHNVLIVLKRTLGSQ